MDQCKVHGELRGTFEIDLNRKRTYEIAEDKLIDFFDSDVVANDELLTKYLAKNKKAVLGEIIATNPKGAKPYYPPFAKDEYHSAGSCRLRKDNGCNAQDIVHFI